MPILVNPPMEKGRAVYSARVLLSYVDVLYVDYLNDCEFAASAEHENGRMAASADKQSTGAIQKIEEQEIAGIFPNPNNGNFIVRITNNEITSLEITNVMGQVVLQETLRNSKEINAAQTIGSGIYLCRIKQGNEVIYQNKLVVKK